MPRPAITSGARGDTTKISRLYRLVSDPAALIPTKKDRKRLCDAKEPTWWVLDDPASRCRLGDVRCLRHRLARRVRR